MWGGVGWLSHLELKRGEGGSGGNDAILKVLLACIVFMNL